jgi:hypothetical protein
VKGAKEPHWETVAEYDVGSSSFSTINRCPSGDMAIAVSDSRACVCVCVWLCYLRGYDHEATPHTKSTNPSPALTQQLVD